MLAGIVHHGDIVMFLRLTVVFLLTFTPALSEEYLDRSKLLSPEENVRTSSFLQLVNKTAVLSDADVLFLVERATETRTSQEESLFLLSSVFASLVDPSLNIPTGRKQRVLPPKAGEHLLKSAENGELPAVQRIAAIRCLMFSLDGSENGLNCENRLFKLMSKDTPMDVREAVVSFRSFSMKRDSNTWKHFISVLTNESEEDSLRMTLINNIKLMALNHLVTQEDFNELLETTFNCNWNREKIREEILATESLYRLLSDIPEAPAWSIKAVDNEFIRLDSSNEYKTYLARELAIRETDNVAVVSEAMRLLLDEPAGKELRIACLQVIRRCKVSEKDFSNSLEEHSGETGK